MLLEVETDKAVVEGAQADGVLGENNGIGDVAAKPTRAPKA